MRKRLKGFISFMLFLFIFPVPTVEAANENKISNIEIEVNLQADGSAVIVEKREMDVVEDTEVYIELSNLGESELLDFQVAGFEEETNWDIDASFEEKAYKYGVLDSDEGYELAWGISEYGQQDYELTYELTNLVRALEDGQSLFWNFDSFLSLPTEQLTLEVSADFPLEEELQDFYGFGFEGPLDLVDGRIQWQGTDLTEGDDVILLLQFPPDTFQTEVQLEQTLAEQRDLALEGSSYNEAEPMPLAVKILLSIFIFLGMSGGVIALAYVIRRNRIRKEHNHFNPREWRLSNQRKKKISKVPPTIEGEFSRYKFLLSKLVPMAGGFSEFFFVYLVIWARQEKIQIEQDEEKGFFGNTKDKARIQIAHYEEEMEINSLDFEEYVQLFEMGESRFDEVIWGMLLEVADADGLVEGKEIEKWSQKNAESIDTLVQALETVSEDWLVEHEYLNVYSVKDWGFPIEIEELTAKGEQFADETLQYHTFIKNLSEISLAEDDDWENLFIWSILFGEAEEMVEHLEEFEPERWTYLRHHYPYYYGGFYGYHYLYMRNTTGLSSAGYSSGAGGMSSVGGGMGAGGGGGGGTR